MTYFLSILACVISYLLFTLYSFNNKINEYESTNKIRQELHKQEEIKIDKFKSNQQRLFERNITYEVPSTIGIHTINF
jgi:Tfp pilus assembly protein PilN